MHIGETVEISVETEGDVLLRSSAPLPENWRCLLSADRKLRLLHSLSSAISELENEVDVMRASACSRRVCESVAADYAVLELLSEDLTVKQSYQYPPARRKVLKGRRTTPAILSTVVGRRERIIAAHGRTMAVPVFTRSELCVTAVLSVELARFRSRGLLRREDLEQLTAMASGLAQWAGVLAQADRFECVRMAAAAARSPAPEIAGLGSDKVAALRAAIARESAKSEASVVVHGESGTGKELAAHRIHAESRRADGPFVTVNCGAIPDGLFETEMFGVEKGAYTGADERRAGCFLQAHRGTLFLDEVAELTPAAQAKLSARDRIETRHSYRRPARRSPPTCAS